jgi:hypothetical protein
LFRFSKKYRQVYNFKTTEECTLLFLSRLEVLKARPEKDVVLLLRVVELVALGPVVAHRVRKDLSVLVEGALGDRLLAGLGGLELGARVLVPERVAAVRAHGGERSVHRVEGYVVYGVDVLQAGAINNDTGTGTGRILNLPYRRSGSGSGSGFGSDF